MATKLNVSDVTDNVRVSTENIVAGDGIFDQLMQTVTKHLDAQLAAGRLDTTTYGTVYLGAMQSVISSSIQYSLQVKDTETKINETVENGKKDRALKDAQTTKVLNESALVTQQVSELTANGLKDRAVKTEQIVKMQEEVDLLQRQESEMAANGVKDRDLKTSQKALYDRQTAGFEDNKLQKLFEAQINAWGLMYSSGILEEAPKIITDDKLTDLYNDILGVTAV